MQAKGSHLSASGEGSGPATAPVQGVREEWDAWDVQERRTALSTVGGGAAAEELILAVEAAKTTLERSAIHNPPFIRVS